MEGKDFIKEIENMKGGDEKQVFASDGGELALIRRNMTGNYVIVSGIAVVVFDRADEHGAHDMVNLSFGGAYKAELDLTGAWTE